MWIALLLIAAWLGCGHCAYRLDAHICKLSARRHGVKCEMGWTMAPYYSHLMLGGLSLASVICTYFKLASKREI